MNDQNSKISLNRILGLIGVLISIVGGFVLERGYPLQFLVYSSWIFVLGITMSALFAFCGSEFWSFAGKAFLGLFSKQPSNGRYVEIAKLGSRYALSSALFAFLLGIIVTLTNIDGPIFEIMHHLGGASMSLIIGVFFSEIFFPFLGDGFREELIPSPSNRDEVKGFRIRLFLGLMGVAASIIIGSMFTGFGILGSIPWVIVLGVTGFGLFGSHGLDLFKFSKDSLRSFLFHPRANQSYVAIAESGSRYAMGGGIIAMLLGLTLAFANVDMPIQEVGHFIGLAFTGVLLGGGLSEFLFPLLANNFREERESHRVSARGGVLLTMLFCAFLMIFLMIWIVGSSQFVKGSMMMSWKEWEKYRPPPEKKQEMKEDRRDQIRDAVREEIHQAPSKEPTPEN
jgi:flagellar motor component MotA